ncbi:AT-rich interactive domain-containing protein 5B [Armadillidium vulgare]|nr:AT-rich interactive domain-containing protein 5B [Armadillidium vulgare]
MTKSNTLIRGLNPKAHSLNMPKLNASNSLPSQIKNEFSTPAWDRLIEVDFMSKLYKFMKERNTAITRLPYIGFKQLNVFELFTRVQQYGGYEIVGQKKLWKHLYEDIVGKQGHQHNPAQNLHSGVNGLKRHYERRCNCYLWRYFSCYPFILELLLSISSMLEIVTILKSFSYHMKTTFFKNRKRS